MAGDRYLQRMQPQSLPERMLTAAEHRTIAEALLAEAQYLTQKAGRGLTTWDQDKVAYLEIIAYSTRASAHAALAALPSPQVPRTMPESEQDSVPPTRS